MLSIVRLLVLFLALLLVLPLVLLSSASARASEDPASAIIVKVGTVAPEGTPWSELVERVKARVQKESDGRLKMKIYLGGRLGGEKEMVREAREGRIQMLGVSTAAIATLVPALNVLEAPFLFASSEEADFVLDGFVRPVAKKMLLEKGFVFFQWAENGWHGIGLRGACITSLADLKGKKVRSQEATIHLDMFKALGANPVEMAVPEVLPALKTGVVDGFSNTPLFSFATSWYQGVSSFTVTDHLYQPAVLAYSRKWFDRLPPDLQKVLLDRAEEDERFGREGVREIREGLLGNFRKANIQVCPVDAPLRRELIAATSNIFDQYKKKLGASGKELFDAILLGKKAWADKGK